MSKSTNTSKKSGFDAPAIGRTIPKGTTFKKNKDGTITPIKKKCK